jgi:hypothetical protein
VTPSSTGAAARGSGRSRLLRRLFPLALVAAGLLLWRSPLLPQPHTLVWDRPFGPPVVSAEVQLWRGDTLLARAEWPDATRGTLSQELTLRAGRVRVLSFARLEDGTERRGTQELELGSAEVVHAPLLPAPVDRPGGRQ